MPIRIGQKGEIPIRHGLVLNKIQYLKKSRVVVLLKDEDEIAIEITFIGQNLVHGPADALLLVFQILEPVSES
jgi:hypothetical protein